MFKTKLVYRLIAIFIVFALMIVIPLSFTLIKQVQNLISEEEKILETYKRETASDTYEKEMDVHKEIIPKLVENMLPYVFYILALAFLLAIFSSRKIILSLKELQKGARAVRDGDLAVKLDVASNDELGDVIKMFNEMALSLNKTTLELKQKDTYINAMLDPLWVVDEKNFIVDINPAFTRLFGHAREDVVGTSIYDYFDDKNAEIMRRQLEEKREKGISSIYEISIFTKTGSQAPVLISGSPIYSEGKIVGKIGILKDFREQAKLRDELQQSRDYLENIMDSIEEEIIVIDKDYRITKANKFAMNALDSDMPGKFCYSMTYKMGKPCWIEGNECPAQIVFVTGENHRTTYHYINSSGEKHFHEIMASPIKDASGSVVQVIEVVRDITDRIRHEEALANKNRELVTLNSISSLLSRSLRPEEIFTQVIDKMLGMLGMDGGGIFFIDDAAKEMVCRYHKGISDEYVKMLGKMRLGEDIAGRVAVTGRIMTTSDVSKDQRIERSMIKHSGIQGYCCIPIKGKERVIGVLCLFSFRPHVFTLEEENILSSIGEMMGIAVENVRLYEKMRELYEFQRKRREAEHAQLLSLSSKLGEAIDMKEIMGNVLELVRDFFSADFIWLLVNDDAGLRLKSSVKSWQRDDELVYHSQVSSIERHAINEREPFIISDMESEKTFYLDPELAGRHYKSTAAIPMFIGRKPVGVFSLYYAGARNFREEELHFLEIIGNILAVSLERADYYTKAIYEKELSDAILQCAADGIITVDADGKIISVNKAFEKMIGALPENTIGLPVCDVFRFRQGNEAFCSLLEKSFETAITGKPVKEEGMLTTLYGNQISVLISSDPIQNMDGQATGVVNLLRDISREKEIDRMKTELVRSVSHEFRTPLSAIVGMTEMILNGDIEEDKTKNYLKVIKNEGLRLSKMVSELLSIARIEAGKESLRLSAIDVNTLIRPILEAFTSQIARKEADIRYRVNGPLSFVGDEEKMRQLIFNIIDNALTFSDNKCIIEIDAHRKQDNMEIIISDNGWGIPEEDIPYITESFYRGRQGRKTKGTGLGLSLCNEIIKMHGGTMGIMSKEGEGTRITLNIPNRDVP